MSRNGRRFLCPAPIPPAEATPPAGKPPQGGQRLPHNRPHKGHPMPFRRLPCGAGQRRLSGRVLRCRLKRNVRSVPDEGRSREPPGQKPGRDRSQHKNTVPVQADKKRKTPIPVTHNLHGPILAVVSSAGLAAHCGAFGTAPPRCSGQGQKTSFESAKTMSERISANPPAISTRRARSEGGRPVTASKA